MVVLPSSNLCTRLARYQDCAAVGRAQQAVVGPLLTEIQTSRSWNLKLASQYMIIIEEHVWTKLAGIARSPRLQTLQYQEFDSLKLQALHAKLSSVKLLSSSRAYATHPTLVPELN